jgi:hypothetical protein
MIDGCQYPVDVDAYGSVGMLSAEIPHVVPISCATVQRE